MSWHRLFIAPWVIFGLWWVVRAIGTAQTTEKESFVSRLSHFALLFPAGLLLAVPPHRLRLRLWETSFALACAGLAVEIAGIAFAIWARETLGRLWSGTVTLKEGHHIVQTGPYRFARHPIYTGILFGVVGVVMARADLAAVLSLLLFFAGIARKVRIEEKLLESRFGDEYEAYRRRVKALIPFVL